MRARDAVGEDVQQPADDLGRCFRQFTDEKVVAAGYYFSNVLG